MAKIMYGDVKCPHCGEIERVPITIDNLTSFISYVPSKKIECSNCKKTFIVKLHLDVL